MAVSLDWRVAVALVLLVALPRTDWDKWRKRTAVVRNGAKLREKLDERAKSA